MLNRNVVSTSFWPGIVSNLSVVSILLLNGKSNRCFNNCFGFPLWAIYPLFQFYCHKENHFGVSTFFWPSIAGSLSVVSIRISNGKSNCCFNNFLDLHCKKSLRCFNSFLKWKMYSLFQQFFGLAF